MFLKSSIDPGDVASVTIGTTHFINAVVEMDRARLAKVAVIRLCGPFSKGVDPVSDLMHLKNFSLMETFNL
jgi:N-methylhydantoinase A/oxoprolinase/acetone carboxylase beta subunit